MSKENNLTRRNFLAVSGTLVGSAAAGVTSLSSSESDFNTQQTLKPNTNDSDIFRAKKYSNWLWIELIGFDNTRSDFGIDSIIERAGFIPAGFSLLLYWVGFVTEHDGLMKERNLSPAEASYGAHPACPERKRQTWTNRQLKSLITELHRRGIKVYLSFFNFCSYTNDEGKKETSPYFRDKDYLRETGRQEQWPTLSMLKRQKDGIWFEDYLQSQTVQTLVDYEFDGLQIADGISSPRLALQEGDYTHEMTTQFFEYLKTEPPKTDNIADYIWMEKRLEWIRFHVERWNRFYTKFLTKIRSAGKEAIFNSAWTRDPFEAIYRYGVDYRAVAAAGILGMMTEDVSSGLCILSAGDNGYLMTEEERRRLHYEFLTTLMLCRAAMPSIRITPLSGIHDTMEQWGVLQHAPTLLTRQTICNLNTFFVTERGLRPITDGPYFCLSDSLSKQDWTIIKRNWILGDTPTPVSTAGVTLVWSDTRLDRELEEFCACRRTPTHKIVSDLLYAGAPIASIARIESVPALKGDLLVTNFDLLPKKEQELILNYTNGKVFLIGSNCPDSFEAQVKETAPFGQMLLSCRSYTKNSEKQKDDSQKSANQKSANQKNVGNNLVNTTSSQEFRNKQVYDFDPRRTMEDVNCLWTKPMRYAPFSVDFYMACSDCITAATGAPLLLHIDGKDEHGTRHRFCKCICVYTGPNRCRIILTNDDWYYNVPQIDLKRKIKEIRCLSKYEGYIVKTDGTKFTCRIPGKGAEVLEAFFE